MRVFRLVILLLVFGRLGPASYAAPVPSVAEGRHFRIVCHLDGPRLARAALEAAEWRLTGGQFRDTGAFTACSTKEAYIGSSRTARIACWSASACRC